MTTETLTAADDRLTYYTLDGKSFRASNPSPVSDRPMTVEWCAGDEHGWRKVVSLRRRDQIAELYTGEEQVKARIGV